MMSPQFLPLVVTPWPLLEPYIHIHGGSQEPEEHSWKFLELRTHPSLISLIWKDDLMGPQCLSHRNPCYPTSVGCPPSHSHPGSELRMFAGPIVLLVPWIKV